MILEIINIKLIQNLNILNSVNNLLNLINYYLNISDDLIIFIYANYKLIIKVLIFLLI